MRQDVGHFSLQVVEVAVVVYEVVEVVGIEVGFRGVWVCLGGAVSEDLDDAASEGSDEVGLVDESDVGDDGDIVVGQRLGDVCPGDVDPVGRV